MNNLLKKLELDGELKGIVKSLSAGLASDNSQDKINSLTKEITSLETGKKPFTLSSANSNRPKYRLKPVQDPLKINGFSEYSINTYSNSQLDLNDKYSLNRGNGFLNSQNGKSGSPDVNYKGNSSLTLGMDASYKLSKSISLELLASATKPFFNTDSSVNLEESQNSYNFDISITDKERISKNGYLKGGIGYGLDIMPNGYNIVSEGNSENVNFSVFNNPYYDSQLISTNQIPSGYNPEDIWVAPQNYDINTGTSPTSFWQPNRISVEENILVGNDNINITSVVHNITMSMEYEHYLDKKGDKSIFAAASFSLPVGNSSSSTSYSSVNKSEEIPVSEQIASLAQVESSSVGSVDGYYTRYQRDNYDVTTENSYDLKIDMPSQYRVELGAKMGAVKASLFYALDKGAVSALGKHNVTIDGGIYDKKELSLDSDTNFLLNSQSFGVTISANISELGSKSR